MDHQGTLNISIYFWQKSWAEIDCKRSVIQSVREQKREKEWETRTNLGFEISQVPFYERSFKEYILCTAERACQEYILCTRPASCTDSAYEKGRQKTVTRPANTGHRRVVSCSSFSHHLLHTHPYLSSSLVILVGPMRLFPSTHLAFLSARSSSQ